MSLYIKNSIHKFDIFSITNANPSEIIAVELMMKENMILARVYRRSNSTPENYNDINKSFEILSRGFSSNLLVVGYFNYPKTDWEHDSTTTSSNELNFKFLECTRDCIFEQFIEEPTRGRESSQPTLIDLVLTNNPGIIDKANPDAPLGKSDHCSGNNYAKCLIDGKQINCFEL